MRPGLPEKATHDYRRNGTTTLFAALKVATGKVVDKWYDRHGKAEFLDFLGIITKQAIRSGSFDSVKELVAAIRTFIECWNERCHPFIWTKTADQILPHATRKPTSDAGH